ncbi:TPA: restriction endonuclease subunit S [Vibrio parahaemolyticus]|nr:restriction endonuclease subunit S [Vibrio parahaemolyticus]HCG5535396.1 restriction endonuclease subunit S [Vibrio parahaemolyticus]HCH1222786.1 restriction endonuclease subunit S [Vibrio parahaemolyticus]
MAVENLITEHIDIWTSAVKAKSTSGRGSSKKLELYGVKKLRELILELAVRGKLVPQDPNDEPASVLLERIAAEKAKLVKAKKIKKQKSLGQVSKDEELFDTPTGWAWTRISEIAEISPRNSTTDDDAEVSFVPMPLITTNYDGSHGSEKRIWKEIKKGYTHFQDGDIALAKITPCFENSKAAVFSGLEGGVGAGTTELHVARPLSDCINPLFVLLYLKAPIFLKVGETKMTGSAGQKRVPKDFFSENPLPFPPSNEQHRIVAKVDELMTLCDQLEQQTEASIEAHQVLLTTLLDTLTNSVDADELMQNWARISEHFDTLFTTEESIDQLKQTILQLAVMGKLVPQDPSDEPASELLKRVAEEKAQLVKEKKIKKQKALPPISEDEKPFELPNGWEWCRLEDVVDIQSGITKGRKLAGRELKTIPYLSVANVQRGYLILNNVKEIDLPIDELEKYSVEDGDLLITEGGDWDKVGRTAIWRSEAPYMAHQNHVFKARPFLKEQSEAWLEMYLNGPFARKYFAGSSKQTTNLASINKTQLRSCLIAVPPRDEKKEISDRVQELIGMCDLLLEGIRASLQTQLQLTDVIVDQAV